MTKSKRFYFTAAAAFFINAAYAVYNAALGIAYRSLWFGALALYFFVLSAIKGYAVISLKAFFIVGDKARRICDSKSSVVVYRNCGIALIILGLATTFSAAVTIIEEQAQSFVGFTIYAAAFYSFYKLTAAIVQIVKSKRRRETPRETLGLINLSDALISMFSLQVALIAAFGTGVNILFNALTGGVAAFGTFAIGVYMACAASSKRGSSEVK